METIRKIRLAYHHDKKPIRQIAREFHLSKNTVKKILRNGVTELTYARQEQPRPKLSPYLERLTQFLAEDSIKPQREQCSGQVKTDSPLSRFLKIPVLFLELRRGLISQVRMEPVAVVKHFNVFGDIRASLGAS